MFMFLLVTPCENLFASSTFSFLAMSLPDEENEKDRTRKFFCDFYDQVSLSPSPTRSLQIAKFPKIYGPGAFSVQDGHAASDIKIGRPKQNGEGRCMCQRSITRGGKTLDILSEPKICALAHYLRVILVFIIESIVERN